jgi:hypothetical protein
MQLAEIVSMILAGALASTVLRGVHFAVAGCISVLTTLSSPRAACCF